MPKAASDPDGETALHLTLPLPIPGAWSAQPGLPLDPPPLPELDDLVWSPRSLPLYRQLQVLSEAKRTAPGHLCVFGDSGSGRTSVLQAVCSQLWALQRSVVFVDCQQPDEWLQDILTTIGDEYLVCLDNLDTLQGRQAAQLAAAEFFDRRTGSLLASMSATQDERALLPDLQSRLRILASYRLGSLDDAERTEALIRRARWRGVRVPDVAIGYLVRHCRPDMATTARAFDRLVAAGQGKQQVPSVAMAKEMLLAERHFSR